MPKAEPTCKYKSGQTPPGPHLIAVYSDLPKDFSAQKCINRRVYFLVVYKTEGFFYIPKARYNFLFRILCLHSFCKLHYLELVLLDPDCYLRGAKRKKAHMFYNAVLQKKTHLLLMVMTHPV